MQSLDVYEILVKEHEKMLLAYVTGITGDLDQAEEIVQAAFVTAFEKLDTLRDKSAFGAWIRTIARNNAMQAFRRAGREVPTEHTIIAQGMEDVFTAFDQVSEGELWEERLTAVRGCYEGLPENLRAACGLHYMKNLKAREVAEQLQLGLAAVLKRLERGRQSIRECVEGKLGIGNV